MPSTNSSLESLFSQAVSLHGAGELEAAEALYRSLLIQAPEQAPIHINLGMLLQRTSRGEEAAGHFREAARLRPDLPEPHNNLGVALQALGHLDEAALFFRKAITLKPDMAEAHRNLGIALKAMGELDEAAGSLMQAAVLRPGHGETWSELGRTLYELKQYAEAADSYGRALELNPQSPEILNDLGAALDDAGRKDDAITAFRKAIALRPDFPNPYNNLGNIFEELGRLDDAEAVFRQAAALNPHLAEVHSNLGNILMERRQIDEAVDCYRRAIALKPDFFEAHVHLGMALLTLGQFEEGWREWEWRWITRDWLKPSPEFRRPLAMGERLDGKTVLLFAEQGFGDVLQFGRYASLLAERGAKVVMKVYPALLRLMRSLPGPVQVIAEGEPEPPHDLRLPMMSAPFVFSTRPDSVPAADRYLTTDPKAVRQWQQRLAELPGLKVGLVWAGDPRPHDHGAHLVDKRRSLALEQFRELGTIPGISWVSLQKGDPARQPPPDGMKLLDVMDDMTDFADTAALVACLDLVITADTAMAHLAGALGKPVWVLSRFDGCWRWMEDRSDSPWYPESLRLFRQPAPGDWRPALAQILQSLTLLSERS